ncbi:hypothetical protein B9D02_05270 [Pantoea vagans]|nr:hypothetical protein [Pantoea vagans]AWP32021.1 hypothetical protein B9D02_05270 [Pantoea vagans]
MRERPIIFNADMVRAVLDGRKTQTRRAVKFPFRDKNFGCELSGGELAGEVSAGNYRNCPFGAVGDRLWVREAYRMPESLDCYSPQQVAELSLNAGYKKPWAPIQLEADGVRTGKWNGFDTPPLVTEPGKLRPSIHMPRCASRITLEITGVRVERLNSINEHDAIAEGLAEISKDGRTYKYGVPDRDGYPGTDDFGWPWHEWERYPISAYSKLWKSIYGDESWQANPFVWVIEFKRVEVE